MLLLLCCSLDVQFLDVLLELVDLIHQLLLILLVLRPVNTHLLSCGRDRHLELLSVALAVVDDGHVLRLVLLEVVEHFQFLVQGNQSVEGVLELNILLLKLKLKRCIVFLLEQGICEAMLGDS